MIRQGIATNKFTKIQQSKNSEVAYNESEDIGIITYDSLTVKLTNYHELTNIKTSTHMLLDALTEKLTAQGIGEGDVTLSMDDYMRLRELSDEKAAREQVDNDLNILFHAYLSFSERRRGRGNNKDYIDVHLVESKGISKGVIRVQFTKTFLDILGNYPVMPIPLKIFRINANKNPNAYALLRKIAEHRNMNAGKPNADIISVKTLLKAAALPTYEELQQSNRAVTQRIIDPFERDMNINSDSYEWEYCHKNGAPLTDEELNKFTYDVFIGLNVHIFWKQYPDQTKLIEDRQRKERNAKRREAYKKKKDAGNGQA